MGTAHGSRIKIVYFCAESVRFNPILSGSHKIGLVAYPVALPPAIEFVPFGDALSVTSVIIGREHNERTEEP